MSEIAICVENISKKYSIGNKTYATLRNTLANAFRSRSKGQDFWALKDVNFTINRGEVVGIIGRNGAGKSTLLKILSKITYPSTGRIVMDEYATSLLEIGTGFHPELTGRENIFLNGAILGMTRAEIKSKFDEIVDFSGVEKFIDTPVKHYSSGMYVRLAFAVSAHIRSNILLVDEVLAVGDYEFQQKCLGKMGEISEEGRTVLFVSHNLETLRMLCPSCMLIDSGELLFKGETDAAIQMYQKGVASNQATKAKNDQNVIIKSIKSVENILSTGRAASFVITIENTSERDYLDTLLDIGIDNFEGKRVGWMSTGASLSLKAHSTLEFRIDVKQWVYKPGKYYFTTYLKHKNNVLEWVDNRFLIQTIAPEQEGMLIPPLNQGEVVLDYKIKY